VNYRSSGDAAKAVVDEIVDAGGRASLAVADISNPAELDLMFAMIREKFGRLDVLVNNAGVADRKIWNARLDEITPDMWSKVFSVDVIGGFMCTQKSVPLLSRGGSIVNISSTPVLVGDTQGLVYACGKAAVLAETKITGEDSRSNIRVNCMILGSIETSWVDWLDKGTIGSYTSSISLGDSAGQKRSRASRCSLRATHPVTLPARA